MAGKEFKNLKELEKYISRQINNCLDKEVAKNVKENIQTSVSDIVYNYEPKVYERRGGNIYGGMSGVNGSGSLGDVSQMQHNVNNGILEVTNNADFNHEFARNHNGYGAVDLSKSLAYNIEYGYGNKNKPWNKPRPFIKETIEILKQTKSHVETLQEGLGKRGLNVVKG